MKRILNILCVSLLCMGYCGCSADESTENPRSFTTLETAEQAVITTREGLTKYFSVTSNTSWTVKAQDNWVHITPQSGNNGHDDRRPDGRPRNQRRSARLGLVFLLGEQRRAVLRPGLPDGAERSGGLADAVPTVSKEGTTLNFTVASYGEYEVDTNCDWITMEPVRTISPQIAAYTFTVPVNEGADAAPGSPSQASPEPPRPR